ncbi:pentapeptide repeat-containing protein [Phormidium tenue FACHB-886]|nr:pentapeptide repeat-containing protein [Phormidium tenue FACHB-886]
MNPDSNPSISNSGNSNGGNSNDGNNTAPESAKILTPATLGESDSLRSDAVDALSRTSFAPVGSIDSFTGASQPAAASKSLTNWIKGRKKGLQPPIGWLILLALGLMLVGLVLGSFWLGFAGSIVALILSAQVIWLAVRDAFDELLSPEQRLLTLSIVGLVVAALGLLQVTGISRRIGQWYFTLNWDALGATGEVIGAIGQILIAILAVYVAWRQYVIGKDLTIQQNIITQQQTIDSYFQGISELVLDEEGLLQDMPLERAIAAGRTAAILSSVDANGKAKVLRFLSRSRLLTPLKRDRRLGRAILDGVGGYAEDRKAGTRVIDLGVMLAGANLSGTDLRWADLSDINLIYANLHRCDLVKTNLSRAILCEADLSEVDMMGARLFYGAAETATPRSRADFPNYESGAFSGAVIEDTNFTEAKRMSEQQRYYCCAWGGSKTRDTIPGGCEGIPNLLGR